MWEKQQQLHAELARLARDEENKFAADTLQRLLANARAQGRLIGDAIKAGGPKQQDQTSFPFLHTSYFRVEGIRRGMRNMVFALQGHAEGSAMYWS